jgi:hypothetical protein
MSYYSQFCRQPNPPRFEETVKSPFFAKHHDTGEPRQKNAFFQAKLSVNAPGDKYEKEADSVATAVVNQPMQKSMIQQKEKKSEKEKKKEIHKKEDLSMDEKKKKKIVSVQAKQDGAGDAASPQVSSQIENSAGKGNQLPQKTLHEMNSSFGTDFSGVKIHHDNEANTLNQELHAQAFTHGNDIYFNKGKYNPENNEGKFLLAHELTHVIQQEGDNFNKDPIQRQVIDRNVVTNDAIVTQLGLTREDIVNAITDADADAIVHAQAAEDLLTEQLAIAISGNTVDPDAELSLNEELGLSFNNPAQHGLIRQQISRFKRVRETLQSGYLRYVALGIGNVPLIGCQTGDCGSNFAFSCLGNRLIVLCQAFWDNPDQQSATVLHEPFHIWFAMLRHNDNALRRADASCFESFALRAAGRGAFASCVAHTAG